MNTLTLRNIPLESLIRAAEIREEIEKLEGELGALLTVKAPAGRGRKSKTVTKKGRGGKRRGGKRNMSPEGIARIKAAQKKRWDAIRAKKAEAAKPKKKSGAKAAAKATAKPKPTPKAKKTAVAAKSKSTAKAKSAPKAKTVAKKK